MDNLPVLKSEVTNFSITSNIDEFQRLALEWISDVPQLTQESTDDDFALAESNVKELKAFEERITTAQEAVISQCGDLYDLLSRCDEIKEQARESRLPLNRDVKEKKQQIKDFVLKTARQRAIDYVNITQMGFDYPFGNFHWPSFTFVPKNAKNLKGYSKQLEDALDTFQDSIAEKRDILVARCKVFDEHVGEYQYLFKDAASLIGGCDVSVLPDLIKSRITAHIAELEAKANKDPETEPVVETRIIEQVNVDTGEVVEVQEKIEMVTLEKSKLLELMQDCGHALTCLDGPRKLIDRVDKLVRYLDK